MINPNWQPKPMFQTNNMPMPAAVPKKGGRGGFATSLISEGGALGGAALGTALLPGIGTVIGAGLGAFAGRLGENKIRDDEFRARDAVTEGLISGALTGVGPAFKALKGAKGAAKAAQAAGVAGKVSGAADDVLKTSLKGKAQSLNAAELARQYGTVSTPVTRAADPMGTVKKLADYGIYKPKDAERIAGEITGANGILNRAVVKATGNAKGVDTSTLRGVFDDALDTAGVVDKDRLSLQRFFDAQMKRVTGGAKGSLSPTSSPSDALDMLKAVEARIANLRGKGMNYRMTSPERLDQAKVLSLVRDELEERLFQGAGANANLKQVLTPQLREELLALSPNNKQWVSFVDNGIMTAKDVPSLRSAQKPFVNIRNIIDDADRNFFTTGGRMANTAAGVKGQVINTALESGRGAVARGAARASRMSLPSLPALGGGPAMQGARSAVLPAIGESVLNRPAPMGGNPLEDAIMQSQQGDMMSPGGFGGEGMDMGMGQDDPYPRENLMYDIQRDPANAEKYIEYYQQVQSIFGPQAQAGPKMSSAQQTRAAAAQNAMNDISVIQDAISGGKVGGLRMLPGAGTGIGSRLLNTENLEAALFNVADNILRARSGAAVPPAEVKRFIQNFLPRATDSPQDQQLKLDRAMRELQGYLNPAGAASGEVSPYDLEEALMMRGGF